MRGRSISNAFFVDTKTYSLGSILYEGARWRVAAGLRSGRPAARVAKTTSEWPTRGHPAEPAVVEQQAQQERAESFDSARVQWLRERPLDPQSFLVPTGHL
jgi:hypothetical protein